MQVAFQLDVMVIGAGVIGLSTAVRLQEDGLNVRVCTSAPLRETTSVVAAALWYPYKAYPEERVLGWGKHTFDILQGLLREPKSGVSMREGIELFREPAPSPWWKDAVQSIRRCEEAELPPGFRDGFAFSAPVVEMPTYLRYLLHRFTAAGGRIEEHAVSSLQEAAQEARVVVNCAGLGARKLAGDHSMAPIRGQIVRVRNPGLTRFWLDEGNPEGLTYVVPRSEDCVLGGTAEEGNWDTRPDPGVADAIVSRCAALEPRLRDAEVLEHKVGLRPGRPEVRLERGELDDGTPLIHNYGHGGSGVTLSWGCAEQAAGLVRETLES